jgi:hypothetical protein
LKESNKDEHNIENTIGSIKTGTSGCVLRNKIKELMYVLESMEDNARIFGEHSLLFHIQCGVKYNALNLLMV